MKVALVMTADGAGGVEQMLISYALALKLAGHQVLAVIVPDSALLEEIAELPVSLHLLVSRLAGGPNTARLHTELRAVILDFQTDVVIAFDAAGLPRVRAALGHQLPVLSHCGDEEPARIKRLLMADQVIATTVEMRDLIVSLGGAVATTPVLPNFLVGDAVAHDYKEQGTLRVGTLARFVGRKGLGDLIAAARLTGALGLRFVVAGDGPNREALKERAKQAGLDLEFPGWISNAAKTDFLADLDIFVVPSRVEPFGLVLLEAMKHGLPVLTTDTTGARAILTNDVDAVIVPPQDPVALAAGLTRLAKDPALRKTLGLAGQARFQSHYTVKVAAPLISRIVETAAAHWKETRA